jgi:uncharacterized repeat protein (TIGR03803 family)
MSERRLWGTICLIVIFSALAVVGSTSDTFTTLASFDRPDGETPWTASLAQGVNGNFYGTTQNGGADGDGTVFDITPAGKITTLYSFCSKADCADGKNPYAGLVLATNGNFYETTDGGGAHSDGTVFEITAAGKLTTLYSFCSKVGCNDGENPYAGLVQATNGNFYGTTYGGGAHGDGTVFKITSGGTLTTLHSFDATDGANPTGTWDSHQTRPAC